MARTIPPCHPSPTAEPVPEDETEDILATLNEKAFDAEQALSDAIALSKCAFNGISDSLDMFNAKHSIRALTLLMEGIYRDVYDVSIGLQDLEPSDVSPRT
jgi:hypothetical protein